MDSATLTPVASRRCLGRTASTNAANPTAPTAVATVDPALPESELERLPLLGGQPRPRRRFGFLRSFKLVNRLRQASIVSAFFGFVVFILWLLPRLLNPTPPDADERKRDHQWVDSSPYWIDRQACRWLSLCGIQHLRWDAPARADGGHGDDSMLELLRALALGWNEDTLYAEKTSVSDWEDAPMQGDLRRSQIGEGQARILEEIPEYVIAHAPLVHLYSGENFWPSDMAEHIRHMKPFEDGLPVNATSPLDLENLGKLNDGKATIFLTSEDDVEIRPPWLHSDDGVPVPFDDDEDDEEKHRFGDKPEEPPSDGTTWWDADRDHPPQRIADPRKTGRRRRPLQNQASPEDNKPDPSGYSKGPAVLVLVDKGSGIVDAFWFFFYSYNLGQTVLNIRFGNHVGDWEHCMTRFQHGIPRAMFLSEHAGGKAYTWKALEKKTREGKPERPVLYSAVGSHAMYASPGLHPYVLPFKMLKDITDKGPLWDPALNNYAFWYDYEVDRDEAGNPPDQERTSLTPAASNPNAPTSWFHFDGYWGDDIYPLSDGRQWRLFGEYHYITGPLGPKFKDLDRKKVCFSDRCTLFDSIEQGEKSRWYS